MQNLVNTYLDKFKNERRTRHRLICILLALALVVGTGVYWQMRLTGAAATNEVFCGLEEHTHTEDCYETVLVCGLEESEGHTHTNACYEEQTVLVCELEENEDHTHTDTCYETQKVLICGLEESEGHTHTDECYEEQLVCGMVEHTHTVECLIDETADVETADDWEATLPALTGVWAEDVVAVAKSQLGYTESTANFTLDDDGETRRGYTRYGEWAGNEYGDWDAMFASFCLHYAGISRSDFPEATGAYAWSVTLKDEGLYESVTDHTPAPGDLVLFDTAGDNKIDSVGIIIEVDEENSELTVIEGDYENSDGMDAVVKNTYSTNDGAIVGYGVLPEQETTATAVAEEDIDSVAYTVEEVQALIDALPSVEEVTAMGSDGQLDAYAQAQEANDAYESLSETEQGEVDVAALDELFEYFNSLTMAIDDEDDGSDENTTTKSLQDYIDSVNEQAGHSASITLTLRTESDSDISGDDESKIITTNTTYHLALTIYSSAGFEANTTYTYSLPEGVSVEAATGSITVEDGTVIGTWTVSDDGTVTLAFNENASEYQDVEVTFTATATIDTTETTITIGDTTYTVSENTNLVVNKSGNYTGYSRDENDYYHGRTWEIEFSQSGVALAGTVVTDYATDQVYSPLYEVTGFSASYDNQHFDTSKPLTFTIVEASTGTILYTWTVDWSDSNLTLYTLDEDGNVVTTTSTSDRIIGWQYTFPNSVTASDSNGETVTVDLTTTDWSPYEFRITGCTDYDKIPGTDWPYRCTYYNSVNINNGVNEDYANAFTGQSYGTYDIDKDWSRGEDGNSINWTIDATIPGGYVRSYHIQDYMQIRDKTASTRVGLNFQEYTTDVVMTIDIAEGTSINGTAITAGTYTVYNINDEVPEDALFVYYVVDSYDKSSTFFVLGMVCHCDEDDCDNWDGGCSTVIYTSSSGTKYCTCWQLSEESLVHITYTMEAETMLQLLALYGVSGESLYNHTAISTGTFLNTNVWLQSATVLDSEEVSVGLALAAKNLTEAPTEENDYTASYEVVINTNHYELTENGADLTITDTLSTSLIFLPSSLVIQATDADGNITTLTSNDYTYSYDSDTHEITINIKNPGTNSYTITYQAQMLNPSSGATYSNSLKLSWQGEDVTVSTGTSYLSEVTTTGKTYIVTILKTDATTSAVLEGATFKLCEANGTVKTTGTTDANGQVTFSTASGTGEGSLTFATHTLYYLEETTAPEGYTLDSTKHYFYFCDCEGETCSSSVTLPDGVTETDVKKLTSYSGFFTITNAQTTYGFTIKKVDSTDSSKTLTGAEFYLYYESAVLDADGNETDEKHQYYAVLDGENAVTSWNSSTSQATKLTVGSDGTISISGLPAGAYYLEEVTAPDGYNLLSNPIKITIDSNGTITEDNSSVEISGTTLTVANTAGYTLPESGGTGTWMYGLVGLVLCGGAVMVLYRRRRSI